LAYWSGLDCWLKLYKYSTVIAPTVVIAPRFFAGEVKFGVIAQVIRIPDCSDCDKFSPRLPTAVILLLTYSAVLLAD
jgi:hypothetical protein